MNLGHSGPQIIDILGIFGLWHPVCTEEISPIFCEYFNLFLKDGSTSSLTTIVDISTKTERGGGNLNIARAGSVSLNSNKCLENKKRKSERQYKTLFRSFCLFGSQVSKASLCVQILKRHLTEQGYTGIIKLPGQLKIWCMIHQVRNGHTWW